MLLKSETAWGANWEAGRAVVAVEVMIVDGEERDGMKAKGTNTLRVMSTWGTRSRSLCLDP